MSPIYVYFSVIAIKDWKINSIVLSIFCVLIGLPGVFVAVYSPDSGVIKIQFFEKSIEKKCHFIQNRKSIAASATWSTMQLCSHKHNLYGHKLQTNEWMRKGKIK